MRSPVWCDQGSYSLALTRFGLSRIMGYWRRFVSVDLCVKLRHIQIARPSPWGNFAFRFPKECQNTKSHLDPSQYKVFISQTHFEKQICVLGYGRKKGEKE